MSGRPLRNGAGLRSRAGNALHCSCPFPLLYFDPETKPSLQCRWSHSYARWAVKPRYWTLAMKFFKDKIINLDLLAEFQSLYLTSYLSSSGSFSYHDLHPLSSLQLPCDISLLTSAEVADYPARVLIQQGKHAFCKNTLLLKDVHVILIIY